MIGIDAYSVLFKWKPNYCYLADIMRLANYEILIILRLTISSNAVSHIFQQPSSDIPLQTIRKLQQLRFKAEGTRSSPGQGPP